MSHKKHRSVCFHKAPGYRPRLWEIRKVERDSERKRRPQRFYSSIADLMKAERR